MLRNRSIKNDKKRPRTIFPKYIFVLREVLRGRLQLCFPENCILQTIFQDLADNFQDLTDNFQDLADNFQELADNFQDLADNFQFLADNLKKTAADRN